MNLPLTTSPLCIWKTKQDTLIGEVVRATSSKKKFITKIANSFQFAADNFWDLKKLVISKFFGGSRLPVFFCYYLNLYHRIQILHHLKSQSKNNKLLYHRWFWIQNFQWHHLNWNESRNQSYTLTIWLDEDRRFWRASRIKCQNCFLFGQVAIIVVTRATKWAFFL